VLDVGSGANPHPRADVLLERHVSGQHRHGAVAVADRPIVFADACRMPFKDKAFDYVIAFHILEHIPTPELFLNELMRIAKAGYVETPNVMFEQLIPYDVHCLEVMNLGDRLFIRKKPARASDPFIAKLNIVAKSPRWNAFFYGNPEYFHVRYHWAHRIDFEVANPEEPCSWYMRGAEDSDDSEVPRSTGAGGLRGAATNALRSFYAFRRPLPDLRPLLVCPDCRSPLVDDDATFLCQDCGRIYPARPWPILVPAADHHFAKSMDVTT
jgi:SAM-dependent methyltransferase